MVFNLWSSFLDDSSSFSCILRTALSLPINKSANSAGLLSASVPFGAGALLGGLVVIVCGCSRLPRLI